MEQHFYPSSLAFNVVCLLEKAVVHATHLGLQRKVLLEMRSQGRDSIGKKHALKKYDQFALNTSCFWRSCAISRYFCYKNNEQINLLLLLKQQKFRENRI